MKDIVHQLKPVMPVQRFRLHTKPLEVIEDVDLNALQPGFRGFQIVRLYAEGNELGFDQTIIAAASCVCSIFVYSVRSWLNASARGGIAMVCA